MNSPCVNCGADSRVCKDCDWHNGIWISKDDYEVKLKADMVAMLEDLKKTIDSKLIQGDELFDDEDKFGYGQGYQSADVDTCDIIQERINALKE